MKRLHAPWMAPRPGGYSAVPTSEPKPPPPPGRGSASSAAPGCQSAQRLWTTPNTPSPPLRFTWRQRLWLRVTGRPEGVRREN